MQYETILYQIKNGVASLTLNRPDVANGFNVPMCKELLQALLEAGLDPAVEFIVLQAKGKVFSVGGDLVEMKRAVDEEDLASLVKIAELVNEISYTIKRLEKPVIMLVDGAVAGAAANMAVAADFCLATDKAKFIQAFAGVGLAPDAGGLFLLTRAIGVTRATHLTMTGESLSAKKALEYGIVYQVCEADQLEKAKDQLLKRLKRNSRNSFKAIKELIWTSQFLGWQDYSQLELKVQKALSLKEDFKEGVRAHAERRRPQFTGQ